MNNLLLTPLHPLPIFLVSDIICEGVLEVPAGGTTIRLVSDRRHPRDVLFYSSSYVENSDRVLQWWPSLFQSAVKRTRNEHSGSLPIKTHNPVQLCLPFSCEKPREQRPSPGLCCQRGSPPYPTPLTTSTLWVIEEGCEELESLGVREKGGLHGCVCPGFADQASRRQRCQVQMPVPPAAISSHRC